MRKRNYTPLQEEIEKLDNLIGHLQITWTEFEQDIYTKIASTCLNIGDMRICIDKIKDLTIEVESKVD